MYMGHFIMTTVVYKTNDQANVESTNRTVVLFQTMHWAMQEAMVTLTQSYASVMPTFLSKQNKQ